MLGLVPLKFSCPADAGDKTSTKYPPLPSKEAKANDTSPQGGDNMGCFICQCLMASEILKVTKGN